MSRLALRRCAPSPAPTAAGLPMRSGTGMRRASFMGLR